MSICHSFNDVAQPDAKVLILGSMPGVKSLTEAQYYAHPRNAFWPIMAAICGFATDLSYAQRLQCIQHKGIALWDVMARCERNNSLDADIVEDSIAVNDFQRFLTTHPQLKAIFFNGGKAQQSFKKYVLGGLTDHSLGLHIHYQGLPSTSPAHASLNRQEKTAIWQQAIKSYL